MKFFLIVSEIWVTGYCKNTQIELRNTKRTGICSEENNRDSSEFQRILSGRG
jgi:hypothetical protein